MYQFGNLRYMVLLAHQKLLPEVLDIGFEEIEQDEHPFSVFGLFCCIMYAQGLEEHV